jgi:septum site-determining protein MinD
MVRRGDMMSLTDVQDILAVNMIGAIPDDENIVVSTNQGEPLVGSNTPAGKAYQNICNRVMGKDVPFMEITGPTFFQRLANVFKK